MKLLYNNVFKNYFLLMLTMFISEIIFRVVVDIPLFDWSVLRIFVGINVISLFCSALFSFTGRVASNILTFVVALASSVYGLAQAGFVNYLGVYMSFGNSSQAGAVKDYVLDYLGSFKWSFWLILIPSILLLLFYLFFDRRIKVLERNDTIDFADKFDSEERKKDNDLKLIKKRKKSIGTARVNALVFVIVFGAFYYYSLSAPFMQNEIQLKSTQELFNNPDIPNIAVVQFGYSLYAAIDIKTVLIPPKDDVVVIEYEKPEQVTSDYTRKIDDTLWEQIMKDEGSVNYKNLNNYYISQKITDKNDYTEFFKNKNLVVIMMESTNNIVLDEKYYPNMYKLASEGWIWENSYSPRNSCSTGNNEMSGMVSLFTINNTCTANNYRHNVYPQAIFNLFNKAGYTTSSFHNYTEQYYYRSVIHSNMGSGHYYGVEELGIPFSNVYQEWPSDVELVNKMLEKTKDQEKFMVWMTSVSAHQPYTQNSELGSKHLDLFADTNYSISLKRYMSKLKEFDLAIGELLDGLEKQGKLDDTVIVLYSDHYPYGLTNSTLNSYFNYNVNNQFNVDKTPFIIYNSNVQAQKFDEYTSFINIVPTVANLFGLEYDPRLYVGHDLFSSDYEDRVVFADGSWKDDNAFYNASTGSITYSDSAKRYTNDEIKEINNRIRTRIEMSNLAIKTNYFGYLEEKKNEYAVSDIEEENKKTEE